jgi:hypothetical protein
VADKHVAVLDTSGSSHRHNLHTEQESVILALHCYLPVFYAGASACGIPFTPCILTNSNFVTSARTNGPDDGTL